MARLSLLVLTALAGARVFASVESINVPRHETRTFATGGLFEGGVDARANLEALRLEPAPAEGQERWVFEFSDAATRTRGKLAPRFQLRYLPAERFRKDDDTEVERRPARLVLSVRQIGKNFIARQASEKLVRQSRFVREIIFYPPIEDGDLAIELVLSQDVLFAPHQPLTPSGRLIVDLK